MAFDFDGKDTIDSTNKETDLDKYGVWVKKPPRNIEETTTLPEDFSQDLLPEDSTENSLLQEASQEPENSAIDDFESMAKEETSDLSAFMDLEDILDEELVTEPLQQETLPEGIIDVDFLDDFTNNISENLEEIEEEFNPFPEPNSQEEPEVAMELPPEFTEEALSFMEENTVSVEDFTDAEGKPVEETHLKDVFHALFEESLQGNQEIEINIDDFMADSDEVSLDEFLSDSGEVSLEAFIDTPAQEKNDILDELPMEMELTFDDDFAVKTATDPVNQMDESFSIESMDEFDQMFDNIVDEAEVPEETQQKTEEVKAVIQDMQFDEVSEFDDFLSDFSQPEPKQQEPKEEVQKDYNLTVTMDDDTISTSEIPETDSDQENNEEILLSTPKPEEKNEKNEESSIARLEITDYTNKGYDSDDFDVDKIMAEVEDIGEKTEEIQPDQVVSSFESFDNQQMQEESQKCITEKPEEAMEFNQKEMEQPAVSPTEELIRNIAGEIALLRNEISSLRNDFEAFKCGKDTATEDEPAQEEVQQETSSGFFADDSDDDTIALSGDELSNIFNTADFTEESVEAETQITDEDSDNGLPSMDFDSETLEEPVIDDDYFQDDDADDFPAEIDVPTGIVAQQEQIFEEIELEEEDQGTEEIFEEVDTAESEFANDSFDVTEEQLEEYNDGDNTVESFEELTEESITEDFVEPALDSFVEEIAEPEEEVFEEPVVEEIVEEISDEPVETVFKSTQWDELEATEEAEPVVEELVEEVVEPVAEETPEEPLVEEPVDEPVVEELVEEVVEPVAEETTEEPLVEELVDEPVETVFESTQWDEPAVDETMGFASNTVEESAFANDPLIIEEPVDTVTVAEEELLEELAEIPVTDALEEITEAAAIEEVAEESAEEVEPAVEVVEEVEAEPVAEVIEEPVVEVVEETKTNNLPDDLKQDIKSVLSYMDQLLDNLPEDKIAEFARSEHFELYKKLFTEFGL